MTRPHSEWITAYLGLGTNMGDRLANLRAAVAALSVSELRVTAMSPVYETVHVGTGGPEEADYPRYLNCVARVETTLSPESLLSRVNAVEAAGKRVRTAAWGPRTIDVDILLFGSALIQTPDLIVPHPRAAERAFVLRPLLDMDPALMLPGVGPVAALLAAPSVAKQRIQRFAPAEALTAHRAEATG